MNISNTPYVNSTELPDGSLVFLADADARGGVRDLEETKASKESVEAIKTAMSGIDPEDATPGKTASVLGWQEYDSVPEVESTETDMASHPLFRASLLDPIVKRDDLVYDDSSKWQAEPKSVIGRIAGLGAKTERLSAEAEHLGTETERLSAETEHLSAETERLSAETEHLGTETEHLSAKTERLDTKTEHLSAETERLSVETERLSAETERLSAETERLDNGQEDLASMLQTVAERVPVKLSEMRDEDGNPTTRTAVKLGADGSLKINYRSGTEYHGLELTGLSDDFYAYDEYNGGHLPDPYIGKWKGPFDVGGNAGNVFVPENQPDPKTEEEALQGWVVWYAYGPDSAQLMYKTGAVTRDFSLNADTIDAQGTGKTETWSSMYIIGHVYFTRERGAVHERTMADMDALNNKANISHTHTKSEITDFPTSMPPTAHNHASDSWFTTAINSKADEAKPSFSTITINGVDYTEWTLGTRSGKIMLSVDMGGISTEIAAFNPVTGVFESAPSQYRDTLRFDGEAPVVGASPTLFDHVARESALSGKANISHTHTNDSWFTSAIESVKSWASGVFAAITHSHASDNWFTSALEDMKRWVKTLLPDWLTPSREEPPTQDFVLSVENKANNARDAAQLAENKAEDALVHADEALAGLDGKANASDFSTTDPAPYVSALFNDSNTYLTGVIDARLPYPLYAVPSTGLLKDRAINTTNLASVTVPDNFTDLLIRASVTTSLPVTMPDAITTKYGDTFPAAAGEYLITITKTGAAEAYVRVIKLEVANA